MRWAWDSGAILAVGVVALMTQSACVTCPEDEVEKDGQCLRPCNQDRECAFDERCEDGLCTPFTPTGPSSSSSSGTASSSTAAAGTLSSSSTGAATSGTTSSTSGSTGGTSSSGGLCQVPADCPGVDTACSLRTCTEGTCGTSAVDEGEPLPAEAQAPGDCLKTECDGAGGTRDVADTDDVPNDHNPCTLDTCNGQVPVFDPVDEGTDCGAGLVCTSAGECAACIQDEDCVTSAPCVAATCDSGVCVPVNVADNTPLPAAEQTAEDCRVRVCDGEGEVREDPDATDGESDDNPCTHDVCVGTATEHEPVPANEACGSGLVCDGAGACVGCLSPDACPGEDTACATRSCQDGACGWSFAQVGTLLPITDQLAGDCERLECNGNGGFMAVVDITDVAPDDSDCTDDVCDGSAPSHPPLNADEPCDLGQGVCNGQGFCVQCNRADQCPGHDEVCAIKVCQSGACAMAFRDYGVLLPDDVPENCQRPACDGKGGITSVPDVDDVPDQYGECVVEGCSAAGEPTAEGGELGDPCPTGYCDSEGACVECVFDEHCSAPLCFVGSCLGGTCGTTFAPAGPASVQIPGDCRTEYCRGDGTSYGGQNNADGAPDDNPCTVDQCHAGMPSYPPTAARTPCSEGGVMCDGLGACVECVDGSDCPGGVCHNNRCYPVTCPDGSTNGLETDVDCGGPACPRCAGGETCTSGEDCESLVCTDSTCQSPSCDDGAANQTEQGVDCGGPCPACECGDWPPMPLPRPVADWQAWTYSGSGAWLNLGTGGAAYNLTNNGMSFITPGSGLPHFRTNGAPNALTLSGNTPLVDSLHKAGATWTIVAEVYLTQAPTTQALVSTGSWNNTVGLAMYVDNRAVMQIGDGTPLIGVCAANGALCLDGLQHGITGDGVLFFGAAVDEARGLGVLRANGSDTLFYAGFAGPSAGPAQHAFALGGPQEAAMMANGRIYRVRLWDVALTQEQLTALQAWTNEHCDY